MLRARVIPSLLIHDGALVKTVRFSSPTYVGDPLNAVRIFNEKQVDELSVFDIDATRLRREPPFVLIERLAGECRMPLCYGGGVHTAAQIERLIALGVEKVAMGSAVVLDAGLLAEASARVGRQSLVAVLDVSFRNGRYEIFLENGTRPTGIDAVAFAATCGSRGAGEILVNNIDRDGAMNGYDIDLARQVRAAVDVPVTMLGGAGSFDHIADLVRGVGLVGAAAGSLFVFKGPRRAVLISYPRAEQKAQLRMAPYR